MKKRILSMLLAIALLFGGANMTAFAMEPAADSEEVLTAGDWPFKDVAVRDGNWKYEGVKYAYEKGIMNGVKDANGKVTKFEPDSPLTRAMFVTVLYRMADSPEVNFEKKFSDVYAGRYYSDAVIWAYQEGIVNGYPDGRYGVDDNITREQMAKMLNLYAELNGEDTSENADLNTFPDKSGVSNWAVKYMKWAVGSGLITGKKQGNSSYLDAQGNTTRAECATVLMRFDGKYGGDDGVVLKDEVKPVAEDVEVEEYGNELVISMADVGGEIKPGDIIAIGTEKAYKVDSVTNDGENYYIEFTKPELGEIVDHIQVEGQAQLDFANFVPAEGVTVDTNTARGLDETVGAPVDLGFKVRLSGDKDLGHNWEFQYKLDINIPTVDYKIDINFIGLKPNAKNVYFKMQEEIQVSAAFVCGEDRPLRDDVVYEYIELGTVPLLGIDGMGAVVEIDLVMNAEGKFEVQYNVAGTLGCQIVNNRLSNISALQSSVSGGVAGEISVGPNVGILVEVFEEDLISIAAKAGAKFGGSANWRSTGMVCMDCGVTVFAEITAFENTVIDDWLDIALVWTIWDENNSPINYGWHFEDLQRVPECTYENCGIIQGTVADAVDRTSYIENAKIQVIDASNMELKETLYSDASGKYKVSVPGGTYMLKISAEGYIPFETLETVMNKQGIFVETFLMVEGDENSNDQGTIEGYITDAVTGYDLEDVTIQIRKNWNNITGDVIKTITTDSSGFYSETLPIGNYTLGLSKAEYQNDVINVAVIKDQTRRENGTMTPLNTEVIDADKLRVVLVWEAPPADLDSHLRGRDASRENNFHVYYSDDYYYGENDFYAYLDIDNTIGDGRPETITVEHVKDYKDYSYLVHNYSERYSTDSKAMSDSGAYVKVYVGNDLIRTYRVPTNRVGTVWHVFDYNSETGVITDVNRFSNQSSPSLVAGEEVLGDELLATPADYEVVDELKDYEK